VGGKTIGVILIAVGLVLLLAVGAMLGVFSASTGLNAGGLALGMVLIIVIVLPIIAAGVFLTVKGGQEAAEMAEVAQEKKLLNMIVTQGKISIGEAALELRLTRDQVKEYVYDLVGKGLFTGYVNWDDGMLMSQQASQMPKNKCPNCGAQLELAGKGTITCPYCGTDIFMSQ
jgi:DNA-directed RNA polymerase subunit RPC12/RpoP